MIFFEKAYNNNIYFSVKRIRSVTQWRMRQSLVSAQIKKITREAVQVVSKVAATLRVAAAILDTID